MKKINLVLIVFMLISAFAIQKTTAQKEEVELTTDKIIERNKCEFSSEKMKEQEKNLIVEQSVSDTLDITHNKNYNQPSPLIGFPSAKDFEE